jgi:hypothetical protein
MFSSSSLASGIAHDLRDYIYGASDRTPQSLRRLIVLMSSSEVQQTLHGTAHAILAAFFAARRREDDKLAAQGGARTRPIEEVLLPVVDKVADKVLSDDGRKYSVEVLRTLARECLLVYLANKPAREGRRGGGERGGGGGSPSAWGLGGRGSVAPGGLFAEYTGRTHSIDRTHSIERGSLEVGVVSSREEQAAREGERGVKGSEGSEEREGGGRERERRGVEVREDKCMRERGGRERERRGVEVREENRILENRITADTYIERTRSIERTHSADTLLLTPGADDDGDDVINASGPLHLGPSDRDDVINANGDDVINGNDVFNALGPLHSGPSPQHTASSRRREGGREGGRGSGGGEIREGGDTYFFSPHRAGGGREREGEIERETAVCGGSEGRNGAGEKGVGEKCLELVMDKLCSDAGRQVLLMCC